MEARTVHAVTERQWLDTMAANIVTTLIRLKGGEVSIQDMLCYTYAKSALEVQREDESVSVFKQWVTVTNGKTI